MNIGGMDVDPGDADDYDEMPPTDFSEDEYREEFSRVDRDVVALAAERQCEVVLPSDSYELQLDLDSDQAYELMKLQVRRFNEYEVQFRQSRLATVLTEWRSRSGSGRHVIVRMPFEIKDEQERIMYQALFGSDPKRELFNLMRVIKGVKDPICLFRPLIGEAPDINF